ncbi:MAG: PQQ-binding-like beta-propeller repeat protein [Chloroflexota bacterium]
MMSQLDALKCPSCTASLEYDGRSETIRCEFCHSTIIVPESLKQASFQYSSPSGVLGREDPAQAASIHQILTLVQQGKKIDAIKLYRETFNVSLKEAKDAVDNLEHGQPTAISMTSAATTTAAVAASTGCSCLLPMLIFLIIAGIGGFVFVSQSPQPVEQILQGVAEGDISQVLADMGDSVSSAAVRQAVYNEPILLSQGGDGVPPDLLLEVWTYEGSDIPISLGSTGVIDGQRQVDWQTQVGTSAGWQYNVGFDARQVYVAQESALQAHARDTGEVLWQTVLSDKVQPNCHVCIRAVKDRVIVLTSDNTLEAFDANTGRSVWQVRLNDESIIYPDTGQLAFALVDDMVGILDELEVDGSRQTVLFLYDAASGQEVRRITPLCPDLNAFFDDGGIDHNSQVFLNEQTGEMTALFGQPAYVQQMCLQKWDVNSGELLLDTRLPENFDMPFGSSGGLMNETLAYPFAQFTPAALLTTLDIEGENGRSTGVVQIDLNSGEILFQHATEDYELAAIAQVGDVILVRAVRQRGSEQHEIWGLDRTSGEQLWKHILKAEYLYELDPFDDRFSYHLQPDGLVVLQLLTDSEPSELLVQKLNISDGSFLYETKTPITAPTWSGLTWAPDQAYLTLQNLLAVDLKTGETAVEWP